MRILETGKINQSWNKKKSKKAPPKKQENFLKSNSAAEISSKD